MKRRNKLEKNKKTVPYDLADMIAATSLFLILGLCVGYMAGEVIFVSTFRGLREGGFLDVSDADITEAGQMFLDAGLKMWPMIIVLLLTVVGAVVFAHFIIKSRPKVYERGAPKSKGKKK
jgi:F0F1-type ATP synthase assembly protein I